MLSLVIVNWNTSKLLRKCLESVVDGAAGLKYEVVVVDNGSTDGSVQMVRSYFPSVHLIENSENLGYSAAVNQGIRVSSGEFVALLNSDIVIPTGSLREIVNYILDNKSVAAASPQMVGVSGSPQYCGGYAPSVATVLNQMMRIPFPGRRTRGLGIYSDSSQHAISVDWLMGAFFIIRMQAIRDVGLLDESFFLYGEDIDYGLRLRRRGWQLHLLPWIRVVHYGGASSSGVSETGMMWLSGVYRIAASRLGRLSYLVFCLLMSMDFFLRFLLVGIAGIYSRKKTREYQGAGKLHIYTKTSLKLALKKPEYAEVFYKQSEKRLKESLARAK